MTKQDIQNLKNIVTNAIREVVEDRQQVFNIISFEADFIARIEAMETELKELKSKKKK